MVRGHYLTCDEQIKKPFMTTLFRSIALNNTLYISIMTNLHKYGIIDVYSVIKITN